MLPLPDVAAIAAHVYAAAITTLTATLR